MNEKDAHVVLRKVQKSFRQERGGATTEVLRDLDLSVDRGEFLVLVGPSGSGKTTLLNLMAGFEKADSGEVLVNGKPVGEPGPDRAMVFQEFALFPWFTVHDNVAFGLRMKQFSREEIRKRVVEILEEIGLSDSAEKYPKELSGGMRQRVALARALVVEPSLLLMDEPFGSVDAQTRARLEGELLALWKERQQTVVFVTHDVEEAIRLGDRIVVLGGQPARIELDEAIHRPRPRRIREDRALRTLYEELLGELGE